MFADRPLNIALAISIIFHAVVILPLPFLKPPITKEVNLTPLEVTYLVVTAAPPKQASVQEKIITPVVHQADQAVPPVSSSIDKSVAIASTPASAQDKKVEIPPQIPEEKKAVYLDYYQTVREKIRRFVVDNYPHYIACGEVSLYFVLSTTGALKDIRIVEAKSTPNRLLKQIAEHSVQQAAPFLPFPKELNQQELSFNVVISFELEN